MPHLRREQVAAQAALAFAGRKDHISEVGLETGDGHTGGLGSGCETRLDGRHGWVCGCGGVSGRHGLADQRIDARQLLERHLRLEPPHRTAGIADEPRPPSVEHGRETLQAARSRREPIRQGSELAGTEREQPIPDEVDPVERVPGVFSQLADGEPLGLELADQQVAIDDLVRGQIGHAAEFGEPAIREFGPFGAAGFGQVGPAIVVLVVPDRGGERRVEPEELGKEFVEAAGEVRHDRESTAGDDSSAQDPVIVVG